MYIQSIYTSIIAPVIVTINSINNAVSNHRHVSSPQRRHQLSKVLITDFLRRHADVACPPC